MTDSGPRFCPRCGTARVAGMPFCPKCGLNVADIEDGPARAGVLDGARVDQADAPTATSDADSDVVSSSPSDATPPGPGARPAVSPSPSPLRPLEGRAFSIPPIVVAALFVMVGLIAFGLLTRPQPGALPGPGGSPAPGASVVAPPPPIVGLSILSPSDGQVVAGPEVTVIGTAPPGLSITQDISFGLDQHATTDGTGHWAIKVGLNEGDNKLTFRIGDDRSTEKTIRVTYTPARTP